MKKNVILYERGENEADQLTKKQLIAILEEIPDDSSITITLSGFTLYAINQIEIQNFSRRANVLMLSHLPERLRVNLNHAKTTIIHTSKEIIEE